MPDLVSLEARLVSRFSQLDREEVRRCLCDSAAQFAGARVRTYLAVLIERAATDRLRTVEQASVGIEVASGVDGRRATQVSQPRDIWAPIVAISARNGAQIA